jgi:hypothetical protein
VGDRVLSRPPDGLVKRSQPRVMVNARTVTPRPRIQKPAPISRPIAAVTQMPAVVESPSVLTRSPRRIGLAIRC